MISDESSISITWLSVEFLRDAMHSEDDDDDDDDDDDQLSVASSAS
jgi:hypothetical protein